MKYVSDSINFYFLISWFLHKEKYLAGITF